MTMNFNLYPFTTPVVMTDDAFQAYGGSLANTSDEQRNSAYFIAEMAATEDVGTLLIPTNVTGSYPPENFLRKDFLLDYTYVNQICWVRFHDFEERVYYTVTGTANVYAGLRNPKYGILDINYFFSNCHCPTRGLYPPYQIEVAYNAGMPTGTSFNPNFLLALTTYSQIILNEIIGWGNEAPGDIGVQNYQNQSYRESRIGLLRTAFGTSAEANFAHKLLTKYRIYRGGGL